MLRELLDLLELSNGETENIRIAKGKYYLPTSFKEAYKHTKKTYEWQ